MGAIAHRHVAIGEIGLTVASDVRDPRAKRALRGHRVRSDLRGGSGTAQILGETEALVAEESTVTTAAAGIFSLVDALSAPIGRSADDLPEKVTRRLDRREKALRGQHQSAASSVVAEDLRDAVVRNVLALRGVRGEVVAHSAVAGSLTVTAIVQPEMAAGHSVLSVGRRISIQTAITCTSPLHRTPSQHLVKLERSAVVVASDAAAGVAEAQGRVGVHRAVVSVDRAAVRPVLEGLVRAVRRARRTTTSRT